MPTPLNGSLGQTTNFTSVNDLITKWPTAAQNQGIKLSGLAFDGVETDYLNPQAIANLTLPTNENPKSWLSYGSSPGIGVSSSYDGWFTDITKIRAEINYNPNTNQSQALKLKWADNQDITSATIDLSTLGIKTSPGVGDQGNEVGLLQIFNNGTLVPASNFTITRLNAPTAPKAITAGADGVTFTGDRADGSFQFKIEAKPLTNTAFDELRFSAKPYDSPTAAYTATSFKDDSSDYLVRKIDYQGTANQPSLQFSAPTFSVNENGTAVAAVTVTRTGGSEGAVSATVNLTNGTATAPGDYNNTAIPVNFAAGDTAPKTITVPIVNDTLAESTETVNLTLANPTGGATIGTQGTATLSIIDNDTLPATSTLQFSAPTFRVREDGVPIAAVTVTRTGSSTAAVSASLNLTNGTATAPADYNNAAIPVNFAAGDSTPKVVNIPIVNDTLVESTETINLTLANPTGGAAIGTQGTARLDIADNDSSLQFSAPTFSTNENGTPIAAVTVTRTGVASGAVSATVSLADGTATAPGDYANTPIAVNFAAGDSAPKVVNIPIVNDTLAESTENIRLTLGSPTGNATIGTQSTATFDIIDNDTVPASTLQFSAPTFSVNEDGTTVAAVTVTRTGSATAAVSATVNLTNGTATAPGDYTGTPIPVNFAAGDSTPKVITVPIVNDTLVEGTETVNLTLANPTGGATIGTQGTASLSIIDNDSLPASTLQFSAPTFSVNEDGTTVAAVTVTRTGSTTAAVSATVNLANGSATAPADYANTAIPVNFAAGDSAPKVITVPIVNDTLVEGTETVNLTLANPTGGATIGTQGTASLNILDNDSSLQFSGSSFSVNEDGTPITTVTVTRTGSSAGAVSGTVSLADGTATAPGDYANTPIAVNFAAGDTTPKTVNIPIVNDTLVEGNETVRLTLGSPTGNTTIGTQNTATVNIVDNDSTLQFSSPTFGVNEDGTPVAEVTVIRNGSSAGAVSANVNLTSGTAIAPGDYTGTPIPVNFADGDSTPKVVTIPIVDDTLVELSETVNLSLVGPTGNATIGTQSTATLNILDNDSSLQFSDPTFRIREDGIPIAAVTVTRTGSNVGAVSASVNLADGTATTPADYTGTPVVVNFADGDNTPKTVDIPIVNDTLVEGNETVNLSLVSPTGNATIGTQGTAILDIADNDSTLQFSSPTFSANEDGTPVAVVTVTRTGINTGAVSATVSLTDGTATAPGDYGNTPILVNFGAGDSIPKTLTIPVVNDNLVEPTENLTLTLGSPIGNATIGTQGTATFDIIDNDSTLQFSAPTFRIREDGIPIAAVTVTRTGSSVDAVSATVNLSNRTAIAPGDYANTPISVNFAAGDSAPKVVNLPIVNDTLVEPNETINLTLANPTGNATIGTQSTAITTIVDNDSTLQFSAPFFTVNEDGTTSAAVTVTRTGSDLGAVSAFVNLSDGSATAPGDYSNGLIAVNFANRDSAPKTITIGIIDDVFPDGLFFPLDETVNLSLVNPTGATIGLQSTAVLTIVDNDTEFGNGRTASSLTLTNDELLNGGLRKTSSLSGVPAQGTADLVNKSIADELLSGGIQTSNVGINSNSVSNFGIADSWLKSLTNSKLNSGLVALNNQFPVG
ncbi:Calx-beta domain-containing protein [Microcoleus sp. CAWBG58]|uniref:beta strand repeat-containing protein n=1 Tax=Microcoleus sp. CAWBG58 TaxID=2841651 RepID=UPI0025F5FB12|nr:Calx-beta domain-containing protein [Microcoleus sp. CAWBG58]